MHKVLSIFLSLTLLFTLSACGGREEAISHLETPEPAAEETGQEAELPTLNILVDFARSGVTGSGVEKFLVKVPGYGQEFTALTETVPFQDPERDAVLTRVKTEIMAGKGPDLFLCENCVSGDSRQSLFPFPWQAMENRVFLNLDGYIDKAEYMEMDKLLPIVMEAGRNEEGQQLLPMGFTFGAVFFDKSRYTLTAQLPMTWDEAIVCEDPMVRLAADFGEFSACFGPVADLEKDTMLISEEELARRCQEARELRQYIDANGLPGLTEYNEEFGRHFEHRDGSIVYMELGSYNDHMAGGVLGGETEFYLVPKYNTLGGVTAFVGPYAAINRNSQHPDEAFRVLDFLLSKHAQQPSGIYSDFFAMPTHMDIGPERGPGWEMNSWNAQQYVGAREQINAVRFYTPVEGELWNVSGGTQEKAVHSYYTRMQMMLAES